MSRRKRDPCRGPRPSRRGLRRARPRRRGDSGHPRADPRPPRRARDGRLGPDRPAGRVPRRLPTGGRDPAETRLERDSTGWILLRGLEPDAEYAFELVPPAPAGPLGSRSGGFRTLPEARPDPKHNPRGLFNVRFEFACGNNQGTHSLGPELGALKTALDRFTGGLHFAILNGDWLYEDRRDYTAEEWRRAEGVKETPRAVRIAPPLAAMWENYKTRPADLL